MNTHNKLKPHFISQPLCPIKEIIERNFKCRD